MPNNYKHLLSFLRLVFIVILLLYFYVEKSCNKSKCINIFFNFKAVYVSIIIFYDYKYYIKHSEL